MTNLFDYYNTTSLAGTDLAAARSATARQELEILSVMQGKGELTPWEVADLLEGGYPITSVRRAITNLTAGRKLRKTSTKRNGPYGRSSFCWEVRK